MISAWDPSVFSIRGSSSSQRAVLANLSISTTGLAVMVTNVYAPTARHEKPVFLAEVQQLQPDAALPWLLFGDFNMTRSPADKNTDTFSLPEYSMFNEAINTMELIELPLRDRAFTWTNSWDNLTLVRLDRAFINQPWNDALPNSYLSSLTRHTSDHAPLVVTVITSVSRSNCFRYDSSWSFRPEFCELILNT